LRRRQKNKRLSIISDIIIFLILLPIILVFLNVIDPTNLKGEVKNDEILLLTKEDNVILKNINDNIKYIKDNYQIDIEYGQSTIRIAQSVSANIQSNLNIIKNNIENLKDAIKKYPDNFFKTFKSRKSGNDIKVILLDKFNNDNIALASRNNGDEYTIYLSNDSKYERAFHHEIFHIIEYSLGNKLNSNNIFDGWNSLNPIGFKYDTDTEKLNQDLVYSEKKTVGECYFLTKYSKTSEKEDRAEIFAELMTCDTMPIYLKSDGTILKKVRHICSVIDNNMNLSSKYLYWKKF
jgi:hypothetical protein